MLGDTAVAINARDERYTDLHGARVLLPLMNREIPIVLDDWVSRDFGTGGDSVPSLPVVALPAGKTVDSPGIRAQLTAVDRRIQRALPDARIASFASTGDRAFVSRDARTTFALVYPKPPLTTFGDDPVTVKRLHAALRGATVGGAPVRVTGFDALQQASCWRRSSAASARWRCSPSCSRR